MMRKLILLLVAFMILPTISFGAMGTVGTKSKDVDINFFGQLRSFPTFMKSIDLNSKATGLDKIGDENGYMSDHSIRNEARVGWSGKGSNWDFLVILEADLTLSKNFVDRGMFNSFSYNNNEPEKSKIIAGQEQNFGLERLTLSYNFGPMKLQTGWNVKFLDINTGGIVHGDDHPFFSLSGKIGSNFSWESLYIIIQDDLGLENGKQNADMLDWRVYSLKGTYKLGDFNLSPFYVYSDNAENKNDAKVNYLAFEAYGRLELGKNLAITPRFEVAYAFGNTDNLGPGTEYDISAMAAYGSLELNVNPAFNPYFGFSYIQGDDDKNDQDINAFNSITNISRYCPTFGIENAMIYRTVPVLGTVIYSNNFAYLPRVINANNATPGYGGVGNTSSGDSPGVVVIGAGIKGKNSTCSYKAQIQHFMYEATGAIEELKSPGTDYEISKDVGTEFDIALTHNFSNNFSIGNVLSVFFPGGAIEDLWGKEYDDAALVNTVEIVWKW